MKSKLYFKMIVVGVLALLISFSSCGKIEDEESYNIDATSEMAQQVGDSMASIDEAGGDTNGSIAQLLGTSGYEKAFARISNDRPLYIKALNQNISDLFISKSYAANCNTVIFGTCTGGQRVRDFAGCTAYGSGVITGNVTLKFSAGTCTLSTNGDTVNRVPNFSITGLRGATFAVTAPAQTLPTLDGQLITRLGAGSYTFSNAGINRKFTTSRGNVVFDSTTTASSISVTNSARSGRTLSGGVLNISNNLTGLSCTLSPTGVSWTAGCNCPTAGSWSGSCTDASTFTVSFGSTCGEVSVTKGTIKVINMDRCQQ